MYAIVKGASVRPQSRGNGSPSPKRSAEPQGAFVPAESLPQREQMPAAPLLTAAYAFVLLALFVYLVSLSRRLGSVNADIRRLEGEIKRGSRA